MDYVDMILVQCLTPSVSLFLVCCCLAFPSVHASIHSWFRRKKPLPCRCEHVLVKKRICLLAIETRKSQTHCSGARKAIEKDYNIFQCLLENDDIVLDCRHRHKQTKTRLRTNLNRLSAIGVSLSFLPSFLISCFFFFFVFNIISSTSPCLVHIHQRRGRLVNYYYLCGGGDFIFCFSA